jgi:proteic killer suppression protein
LTGRDERFCFNSILVFELPCLSQRRNPCPQLNSGSLEIKSLTCVTQKVTIWKMIKSFKHKGLKEFFFTGSKKGIRPEHADRLERILDRLNAANEIKDMNYPGSNLHKLSGDKKGLYAVNVSGNWRMFFEFIEGDAHNVDYDDYH